MKLYGDINCIATKSVKHCRQYRYKSIYHYSKLWLSYADFHETNTCSVFTYNKCSV